MLTRPRALAHPLGPLGHLAARGHRGGRGFVRRVAHRLPENRWDSTDRVAGEGLEAIQRLIHVLPVRGNQLVDALQSGAGGGIEKGRGEQSRTGFLD